MKKEATDESVNVLSNKGELILLYLFGVIALSIAFFDQIK